MRHRLFALLRSSFLTYGLAISQLPVRSTIPGLETTLIQVPKGLCAKRH